jgi:hypothetical protein
MWILVIVIAVPAWSSGITGPDGVADATVMDVSVETSKVALGRGVEVGTGCVADGARLAGREVDVSVEAGRMVVGKELEVDEGVFGCPEQLARAAPRKIKHHVRIDFRIIQELRPG